MTHAERVDVYLDHIVEAIDRAVSYLASLRTPDELRATPLVQDAVIRNIVIIGEAANRIQSADPAFVERHPGLPWVEMRGMRNKVVHEYFAVDWAVVWRTVKGDLPRLRRQITELNRPLSPAEL